MYVIKFENEYGNHLYSKWYHVIITVLVLQCNKPPAGYITLDGCMVVLYAEHFYNPFPCICVCIAGDGAYAGA